MNHLSLDYPSFPMASTALDLDLLAFRERRNQQRKDEASKIKPVTLRLPSETQYLLLRKKWDEYKTTINSVAISDYDTLCEFFFWYAKTSKGRISQYSTITTLQAHVGRLRAAFQDSSLEFSREICVDVQEFIATDLKELMKLSDLSREKSYADWEDIKIIIRYILAYDEHQYRDERIRLQLILLFLLVSDDGERIGAIVRSDCYREEEESLTYQDVELFLAPSNTEASSLRLKITYNNRKGERGNPKRNLVQEYFPRADYAHCIVTYFLSLAFIDNAIEAVQTPSDLFKLKNHGDHDIPLRFRKSVMSTPIFRRMESVGSSHLSLNLPWSSTSSTQQSQRVVRDAGFEERFTLYNVRRGVNNSITDMNIPEPRRKQLMGHRGPTSDVYNRWYRSNVFTIDTGNMFRKEPVRDRKSSALNMRSRRDPNAPKKLSKAQEKNLFDADMEIQQLLRDRKDLKARKRAGPKASPHIKAEAHGIRRKLSYRREYLKKVGLKKLREKHFDDLSSQFIQSQLGSDAVAKPTTTQRSIYRAYLVDSLYTQTERTQSMFAAVNALIVHCTGDKVLRSSARPFVVTDNSEFTTEDGELLLQLGHLTSPSLTWREVGLYFPGRSEDFLKEQRRLPDVDLLLPLKPAGKFTMEDDILLIKNRLMESRTWAEIAKDFPGRPLSTLRNRLSIVRRRPYGKEALSMLSIHHPDAIIDSSSDSPYRLPEETDDEIAAFFDIGSYTSSMSTPDKARPDDQGKPFLDLTNPVLKRAISQVSLRPNKRMRSKERVDV